MAIADLEKIVKIIFAGDNTSLDSTINSVNSGLQGVSTTVTSSTQPFANLTQKILLIDAALAALAIGGLVVATNAAGNFGDSFSEISTLIDVPKAKLSDFKTEILDYATTSTQSIDQINNSIYDAISAGVDYTDALDILQQAENLGIATKAELNTAMNLLVPTLNAFGLSTDSAADFADILFTTVQTGKTTLDELAPVLGNVTAIANSAGIPFSDLAAAVAALTASGVETSQAVTQLKSAIIAITAPTVSAKAAAADLGVELGAEAIAAQGLNGVFESLVLATDGNIEKMKLLIPRVEGVNAALILGKDAAGKYDLALQAMSDRADAAVIAYQDMKDNFNLINQNLVNNLQATLIGVGQPLLAQWQDIAVGIAQVFQGVSVGFEAGAFDGLMGVVEGLAENLAAEFSGIAEALPEALAGVDFTSFENSLQSLVNTGSALLNNLFSGLDLTQPEDLEIAIQGVVDAFTLWVSLTEGIVDGLTPFISAIVDVVGYLASLDEDTAIVIGQFLGWATAINTAAAAIVVITAPLALLSGSIQLLSLTHIPSMIGGIGSLVPSLGALGTALQATVLGAAAFAGGFGLGTLLYENVPAVQAMGDSLGEMAFDLVHLGDKSVEAMEAQAAHTQALGDAAVAMALAQEGIQGINAEPSPEVSIDLELNEFFNDIDAFEGILNEIADAPTSVSIDLELTEFFADIDTVNEALNEEITPEQSTAINLELTEFFGDIDEAEQKLDEGLPTERLMEIQLQGEIDTEIALIEAQAETLQTAFEWTAKVEIASIEAAAKELEAVAGTIEAAWQSTGDVISAALGVLNQDLSGIRWLDVIKIIDREQDLQEEIWETQKLLIEAQTAMIEARAAALAKGEPIITITTDGLEPELEQVLYSIVQKAQIKANEEGFAALLGI